MGSLNIKEFGTGRLWARIGAVCPWVGQGRGDLRVVESSLLFFLENGGGIPGTSVGGNEEWAREASYGVSTRKVESGARAEQAMTFGSRVPICSL